ncbi:hypothetical protein J2X01_002336 [Arthrobacter ginsengisoli]|uniref:DUF2142 domain-containing protein n=1 Tax=Arthrobacter ginsengisoli TaxID=1356565 RepID=A0ABU1UCY2_9MICC|nr:DUF2142 domain-containing protein [Arthrobacter ginsengisoli]MDR7083046.1 hypothetical protein [Arthrobacter ginsengisoli]
MKHAITSPPDRHPGVGWFWWPLLVIFVMSSGWALASPISSVPDEPAHIVKAAAVVRGELVGAQTGGGGPLLAVQVPRFIEHTNQITCFVRNVAATPKCSPPIPGDPNEMVAGLTTAGLYNPVYYAAVGWPSLLTGGFKAVYGMRLVSALLTSIFLALAFSALSRLPRNKWAIITLAAAVTPMTLFLNGSVNPNSLEYGTTAAIAANLLLLLKGSLQGRALAVPVIATTAAAALLANTKALSLLWLLVIVVAVVILGTAAELKALLRRPAVWAGAAVIGLSCAYALWWIGSHNSLASKPFDGAGLGFDAGAEIMIDRTFLFMHGYIGQFGWLELDAPTGVMALWTAVCFAAVLAGIIYGRGRYRAATIFLSASLLLLPVLLQAVIITDQGMVWQGRYILAIFVPCLMIAGIALDNTHRRPWPAAAVPALNTLIVLLAASQVLTFIWVLRRYVTGLAMDIRWVDLIRNPQWQPPLGTLTAVTVFVAATVLGAFLLLRHVRDNSVPAAGFAPDAPRRSSVPATDPAPVPVNAAPAPPAVERERLTPVSLGKP